MWCAHTWVQSKVEERMPGGEGHGCESAQVSLSCIWRVRVLLLDVPWPRAARAALQRPHPLCSVV